MTRRRRLTPLMRSGSERASEQERRVLPRKVVTGPCCGLRVHQRRHPDDGRVQRHHFYRSHSPLTLTLRCPELARTHSHFLRHLLPACETRDKHCCCELACKR